MPNPHSANICRVGSDMTLTFQAPPSCESHFWVMLDGEWDMAMKGMVGCLLERARSWRKVCSATRIQLASYSYI